MGSIYRQKEVHGVKVIYVQKNKTRSASKAYISYRGTWLLLPDGSVGYSDVEFFKYAYVGIQRRDVAAAEALWKLGAITKDIFLKVEAAEKRHREKQDKRYAASEFQGAAKRLGVQLTKPQEKAIAAWTKLSNEPPAY